MPNEIDKAKFLLVQRKVNGRIYLVTVPRSWIVQCKTGGSDEYELKYPKKNQFNLAKNCEDVLEDFTIETCKIKRYADSYDECERFISDKRILKIKNANNFEMPDFTANMCQTIEQQPATPSPVIPSTQEEMVFNVSDSTLNAMNYTLHNDSLVNMNAFHQPLISGASVVQQEIINVPMYTDNEVRYDISVNFYIFIGSFGFSMN